MCKTIDIISKTFIMIAIIFVSSSNTFVFQTEIINNDNEKTTDVSKMSSKIDEFTYDEIYGAKETYEGDLTGYSFDCPACSGLLYCNSHYDITDGTLTYFDKTYGEVRIVASSNNLPCGTIIRFKSSKISSDEVYAIVLDRGVFGTAIDLLTPSEEYASKYIGRSIITYDVVRKGY